jgi:hypothetical protein
VRSMQTCKRSGTAGKIRISLSRKARLCCANRCLSLSRQLWVIRYIGGQGSKLSDVCLAPKATDNRLETARREVPIADIKVDSGLCDSQDQKMSSTPINASSRKHVTQGTT